MKSKKEPKIQSPFSENLRKVSEERQLSQRAIAEIAGIPLSTLNTWLNGAIPTDHMAVLKLCKALSLDYQWLMTGEVSNSRVGDLRLDQIFSIEDDASFSGIFQIEAKRLKRRKQDDE